MANGITYKDKSGKIVQDPLIGGSAWGTDDAGIERKHESFNTRDDLLAHRRKTRPQPNAPDEQGLHPYNARRIANPDQFDRALKSNAKKQHDDKLADNDIADRVKALDAAGGQRPLGFENKPRSSNANERQRRNEDLAVAEKAHDNAQKTLDPNATQAEKDVFQRQHIPDGKGGTIQRGVKDQNDAYAAQAPARTAKLKEMHAKHAAAESGRNARANLEKTTQQEKTQADKDKAYGFASLPLTPGKEGMIKDDKMDAPRSSRDIADESHLKAVAEIKQDNAAFDRQTNESRKLLGLPEREKIANNIPKSAPAETRTAALKKKNDNA